METFFEQLNKWTIMYDLSQPLQETSTDLYSVFNNKDKDNIVYFTWIRKRRKSIKVKLQIMKYS